MNFKFKQTYWIGIIFALFLMGIDIYLYFALQIKRWLIPIIIIALNIGWLPFWFDFFSELKRQKTIEEKFLEFIRNIVDNVHSGITITKGIVNVANEDYGPLSPHVKKLARQLEWGISLHKALRTLSYDTGNIVIKRSVSIIIEADVSGGDIEDILDAVTVSVVNIKKMKEERKSSVYSQIVQGYIVFFVFIAIMLVLQLWLFPLLKGSLDFGSETGTPEFGGLTGIGSFFQQGEKANLDFIFFALIMIQGFFAGIMIGKFSEGSLKQGLLHSLILMTVSALLITSIKGGI